MSVSSECIPLVAAALDHTWVLWTSWLLILTILTHAEISASLLIASFEREGSWQWVAFQTFWILYLFTHHGSEVVILSLCKRSAGMSSMAEALCFYLFQFQLRIPVWKFKLEPLYFWNFLSPHKNQEVINMVWVKQHIKTGFVSNLQKFEISMNYTWGNNILKKFPS